MKTVLLTLALLALVGCGAGETTAPATLDGDTEAGTDSTTLPTSTKALDWDSKTWGSNWQ